MKTGRVYKIVVGQSQECYVGSTFNELKFRFRGHKSQYQHWKEGKGGGNSSFELFDKYGLDNCKMILIKEYECVDRAHLEAYETLWINKLKSVNKSNPFGNGIKFLVKQRKKKYNEENKEAIAQKMKQYYEGNKEIIAQRMKEYREENKDKKREYNKEYYEQKKEVIAEKAKQKNKEKIKCECGAVITKIYLSKHKKSQKHINKI